MSNLAHRVAERTAIITACASGLGRAVGDFSKDERGALFFPHNANRIDRPGLDV